MRLRLARLTTRVALVVASAMMMIIAISFSEAPVAAGDGNSFDSGGEGGVEGGDQSAGEITVKKRGSGRSSPPPPPPPPCSVSVRITIFGLTYNGGLARNNPDGTYYPGDAFSVSLAVNSLHCTSVSTSLSGDSGISIKCPNCTSTLVDVSPFASQGLHMVRASVYGTGPGGSGFASESRPVVVANPMITVRAIPADVTDKDGYLMRNADNTHYVNDAVALRYEVDYRFKDARRDVVEPDVTTVHPYPRIGDQDCLQESCTLVVPATAAMSEYRGDFAYATGISVANSTATQGFGPKTFKFDVRLKNAGVYTGMGTTYRHVVSIVDYKPLFATAYPYLNLKDGGDRSYEKKLMIGLHYLGSSDADGAVKALRRAKLNLYTNAVSALVIGTNSTDTREQAGLTWLSTSPFYAETAQEPAIIVTEMEPGKNAVLERAGYAKVAMKMERYDPDVFARMHNVTAFPAFYTKDFAGKEMVKLFEAAYTYPDTYFANTITAKVLDGNSTVSGRSMRLEVWPATGSTTTVCEYYDKRSLHFTGDIVFSEMALSDVYPCSATVRDTDAGMVKVRANMTGILIPKIYDEVYPGGLAVMPPFVALASPSSMMLQMSVSGISKVRTYELVLYTHDRDAEIFANIGQNNELVAVRDGATVTVKSPENFGAITGLQANGFLIKEACSDRCTLDIPDASKIVATNEWGGKATAVVVEHVKADSSIARAPAVFVENNGQNFIFAVFGAAGAAVAGVIFRKYVSWWLGDFSKISISTSA